MVNEDASRTNFVSGYEVVDENPGGEPCCNCGGGIERQAYFPACDPEARCCAPECAKAWNEYVEAL